MSEYFTFVKRVGLVGVTNIIVALKGLIVLPVITKTLGADDFGVWTQILVMVALIQPLIQLGLPAAVVRFLSSRSRLELSRGLTAILLVILGTGLLAGCVLFLVSGVISDRFFNGPSSVDIIRLACPLLMLDALNSAAMGTYRIIEKIRTYSLVTLSKAVVDTVLISVSILSGYGIWGAVLSLLVSDILFLIINLTLVYRNIGLAAPAFSWLPSYFAYSLPLVPTSIFEYFLSASDRYIIAFYLGTAQVGIYSAGYSLGSITLMLCTFIIFILRPTLYRGMDGADTARVKNYLSYSFKYMMMLVIPIAVGLSVLAEPLLIRLTTAEFLTGSGPVVPLVAFAMLFYSAEQIFASVVLYKKNTWIFPLVFAIAAVINIVLNILLVPRWGVIASAFTLVIVYVFISVFFFFKSRQYLKFDLYPVFLLKCLFSALVMGLAVWLVRSNSLLGIFVSILLGIVLYFAVLALVRGFSRSEIQVFLSVFKSRSRPSRPD